MKSGNLLNAATRSRAIFCRYIGLSLAISSSIAIGTSFIITKKGATGCPAAPVALLDSRSRNPLSLGGSLLGQVSSMRPTEAPSRAQASQVQSTQKSTSVIRYGGLAVSSSSIAASRKKGSWNAHADPIDHVYSLRKLVITSE